MKPRVHSHTHFLSLSHSTVWIIRHFSHMFLTALQTQWEFVGSPGSHTYLFWHLLLDYLHFMQKPVSFTNVQRSLGTCSLFSAISAHGWLCKWARQELCNKLWAFFAVKKSFRSSKSNGFGGSLLPAQPMPFPGAAAVLLCNWAVIAKHFLTSTTQASRIWQRLRFHAAWQ